jgi:V8-like Glu-specific endopeptidase
MSFDSSLYPYDTVVHITDMIDGQGWQGSGVLISPDEVLTASHVVYNSTYGTASDIQVAPAYNYGAEPFGVTTGTYIHYFTIQDANEVISNQQSQFDYAVIHLAQPFAYLGTMGLESNFQGGYVNVTGYPAVLNGGMENSPQYVTVDPAYSLLEGTAIGEGSSGGPVWISGNGGEPYVVGLVSSAAGSTGYFTQITTSVFNQIEAWVAQDDAPPPPPRQVVDSNNLALSGDVTGAHNFIDTLNFVASYGDLMNAFGTNQQAAQNWYNTYQPAEQRVEIFDGLDYVASYSDLINAFKSAGSKQAVLDAGATHFINSGYKEGRNITFNSLDYIASYGDLINAFGANGDAGAYHYIESGASEGRTTTFDGLDYIASYGDLINAFGANEQAGATHFIDNGYKEGRTTTFNGLDYIASYGDLIQAFGANNDAGATHYIDNGHNEGRTTTFDGLDYIASYGDLINALGANEQAGAEHFIDNGFKEGRTTTFDGLDYIANYTDLMNAFGANNDEGAAHYITNGHSEGRSTTFNVGAYESAHPDLIGKFSSNDAFLTDYISTYKATGTFLT